MSTNQVLEFDRNLCKQGNIYGCMAFYYIINKQNPTMPPYELTQWVLNYNYNKGSNTWKTTTVAVPTVTSEPTMGSGVTYKIVDTQKGKALAVMLSGVAVALIPLAF